jgi:hypothetical protein
MKFRCYFCDQDYGDTPHLFKIGLREEQICIKCYTKMENRKKTLEEGSA